MPVVLAADVVMAVLGAVFAPTVAAITLGLVGRADLAERLGRNAAYDRAGYFEPTFRYPIVLSKRPSTEPFEAGKL